MSKNGIDFIIGAKQTASTAMEGVEKLLKRLTVAAVAYKSVVLSKASLDKINEAYDAQAESVRKLTSALEIRGKAGQSGEMQAMAKNLETLTGVSDNTTLALMHQASGMGFAAGAMDDAAKAALGLANATGKDAATSLGDLKAALQGDFSAFAQVNPQILLMRSNQEKMAAVLAIANQGIEQQSKDMGTVAGSGRRAETAMTSLMESIGKIIAPIRVLINAGLQQLSESLTSLVAPAAEYATKILENIGPIMDWVKEKVVQGINIIIGAFTFFETIVTNLGSVWELAKLVSELAMEKIVGVVMHALTVQIPAYASWFAQNFFNLIRDGLSATFTVVVNIIGQIVDAFVALWDFIASGGSTDVLGELGQISGRSWLEGFESSLTALPEVAGRALSAREKTLSEQVGEIGGRLGQQFSDKFSERMVGVGSELSGELNSATRNIDLKMRQTVITQGVQATQGRLLTRGPGTLIPNKMDEIIRLLKNPPPPKPPRAPILVKVDQQQMQTWDKIQQNTSNTLQMEAIV